MKKCFFLDRDGVINIDKKYVYRVSDFIIFPGVENAIKYLNNEDYLVIIVTNQSGIGRGLYTKKDFFKIQDFLKRKLRKFKAKIDDIFFCPHHPIYGKGVYKKNCSCRKPNNGMLESAIKKWNIDRKRSFMIGDKDSDLNCAKKSKVNFIFKKKGNFYNQIKQIIKDNK